METGKNLLEYAERAVNADTQNTNALIMYGFGIGTQWANK